MSTVRATERSAAKDIEGLFREGLLSGLTDAELLARFVETRDQRAFELIVSRYAQLVYRIGQGVLGASADVDDVFQATFLALVRKAPVLWLGGSLAPWLQRVAFRFSLRAKKLRQKGGAHSISQGNEPAYSEDVGAKSELVAIVHAEIDRLPNRYRSVVVLCDLEGMSQDAAAKSLGCPIGTVGGRLTRARRILKDRLTRRGFAVASALAAASLQPADANAAKLNALSATVIQNLFEPGFVNKIGLATPLSVALEEIMIFVLRWRTPLLIASALAFTGGTGYFVAAVGKQDVKPPESKPRQEQKEANANESLPVVRDADGNFIPLRIHVAKPGEFYNIELLQALPGRPVTGQYQVHSDGTINLGFYGEIMVAGLTRKEIKEKVVEHMRKYLTDESLGLEALDGTGKKIQVPAAETDTVSVEELSIRAAGVAERTFRGSGPRTDPCGSRRDQAIAEEYRASACPKPRERTSSPIKSRRPLTSLLNHPPRLKIPQVRPIGIVHRACSILTKRILLHSLPGQRADVVAGHAEEVGVFAIAH